MPNAGLLLGIVAYLAAGKWIVARMTGGPRELLFGLLNVAACYAWFFGTQDSRYRIIFVAYLAVVGAQYLTMRWFSERQDWRVWLAFFSPIAALVVVRYLPTSAYATFVPSMRDVLRRNPDFSLGPFFVGISYLAFRTSHLVLEVRNGVVKKPGLWEYLGFSFFVPTMPVGPINTYGNFRSAFSSHPPAIPSARAALRLLVGLVKYRFLGALCNQLTYSAILLDGRHHGWLDLIVAAVFYYLFLYCNFSGFCDVAIGAAGLMGIPVPENFANPFGARNVKEFWNRWHITLSTYMRDVVFSPLSKTLVRLSGPARANHAIAVTIVVVFLLIGIWHGVGWNYAAFGAMHALGVVTNHYYTIALKNRLGRDRFRAYNNSNVIRALAVMLTFAYVAASLFLFANTPSDMTEIVSALSR